MKTNIYQRSLIVLLSIATCLNACKQDNVKPTPSPTETNDSSTKTLASVATTTPLSNMFGVNTYPWDFLQNPSNLNDVSTVYQPKMTLITASFSQVRHYLDWNYLEDAQNSFTYNPCNAGSWNLDAIYAACKSDNITSLVDIKNCPGWFLTDYYPASLQNSEDVPAPNGSALTAPASYLAQGEMAFQFAARYGSNAAV